MKRGDYMLCAICGRRPGSGVKFHTDQVVRIGDDGARLDDVRLLCEPCDKEAQGVPATKIPDVPHTSTKRLREQADHLGPKMERWLRKHGWARTESGGWRKALA